MIELRFHRELYDATAVDEALKTFDGYATFERDDVPSHFVVRLTAGEDARERRIAAELSNFALGLTIRKGGTLGATA